MIGSTQSFSLVPSCDLVARVGVYSLIPRRGLCRRPRPSPLPERKILECASHPFLVKMHYAFQTPESLYIVMNFANGGALGR